MLSHWFIMLPEILLVLFVIIAGLISRYRNEKTPKTFFTLAQFFMILSLIFTVIFYNKSVFPTFLQNTPFITLFKSFTYILSLGWLYLSSKWFLNKNRPSGMFCSIIFMQLLLFDVLVSSVSLLTLSMVVPLIFLSNICLIMRHWDIDKVKPIAFRYAVTSLIFTVALWIAVTVFFILSSSFTYIEVQKYLASCSHNNIYVLIAVSFLVAVFMFMLGQAPFHMWFLDFIGGGVLPVCGFITLVPPLMVFCALINLLKDCLLPFSDYTGCLLLSFATLSIIIGALSSNGENNIRRLVAYLTIYCWGICLISLTDLSSSSIIASFAYIITSTLSFAGVYAVFLGFKFHGEYLSDFDSIKGFANSRPYMAAALMIFMFSFIGIAPTFGLSGYMLVINNLLVNSAWLKLIILIAGMFIITRSCLSIIRAVYFNNTYRSYDRPDKSVYICLFIIVTIIFLSLFNPNWLMRNAVIVIGGIG